MKINEVYSFLNYVRRKDPIGGSISIPEYNQVSKRAVFEFFKKIMGLPEQYQKGARDPIIGYGLNSISEEKIRPLKVLPTTLNLTSDAYADYPVDYYRHGSCHYTISGLTLREIQIPFVNDAKFIERMTTVLDPPSFIDPVANLQATKIRFLPTDLYGSIIKLEYIKYPTIPIMGYVVDSDTGENIYVENGAYIEILTPGVAGNTITATSGATTFGAYTTLSGDTAEDVMIGLRDAININTLSHNVKAVYDGEKVVLVDSGISLYVTLTTAPTGSITLNKTNFSDWSTQFDWENDTEAMNDIVDIMLDIMGISNRDVNIVQWAKTEQVK